MSVKVAGNFLINALKSGQELPKSLKKYTKEVAGQRDALAKAVKNKPRRTKKIMLKNPEDFNIRKPGGGVLGPRKNYKKGGTVRR
jgi:hypothetical protein